MGIIDKIKHVFSRGETKEEITPHMRKATKTKMALIKTFCHHFKFVRREILIIRSLSFFIENY